MVHTLACALFCGNADVSPYPPDIGTPWWVWAILVVFGLAAVIGVIVRVSENWDRRKRGLPAEPWTDMSPATRSLLSGRDVPVYTAPVNAVTPGGVRVRQSRCCARGHQSPTQAVAHAAAIKRRIETTGR
jgi:hypothetical protein